MLLYNSRENKTLTRFVIDLQHKYIGLINLIDGEASVTNLINNNPELQEHRRYAIRLMTASLNAFS